MFHVCEANSRWSLGPDSDSLTFAVECGSDLTLQICMETAKANCAEALSVKSVSGGSRRRTSCKQVSAPQLNEIQQRVFLFSKMDRSGGKICIWSSSRLVSDKCVRGGWRFDDGVLIASQSALHKWITHSRLMARGTALFMPLP